MPNRYFIFRNDTKIEKHEILLFSMKARQNNEPLIVFQKDDKTYLRHKNLFAFLVRFLAKYVNMESINAIFNNTHFFQCILLHL